MQYRYEILIDSYEEAASVERGFQILGASFINQEGWPTSYGGTGIRLWATSSFKRKDIKDMVSCTETGKIVLVEKISE